MQYIIKKGNNYSSGRLFPRLTRKDTLAYKVKFFDNAIYLTADPYNQMDINKLFGLSESWFPGSHHDNSARFGWRYNAKRHELELLAYIYENGKLFYIHLEDVELLRMYECKLEMSEDGYHFYINGKVMYWYPRPRRLGNWKYYLYPYFGGDEPAPHDINLYLKEI